MIEEVSKNAGKTPSAIEAKRADRKGLAIRYYYQGYSVVDIAAKIKAECGGVMNTGTLSNWIREHLEVLKTSRPDLVENFKFVELEKINRLEIAYWSAWDKSSSVQVTTTEIFKAPVKVPGKRIRTSKAKTARKKADDPPGELESTKRETKTLTGEARFLQGVQWCVEQRIKLLGVEAPKKNEIGNDEDSAGVVEGAAQMDQPKRILFKVVGNDPSSNVG